MKVRALSPELAEKARLDLNEDPARIPGDLQHLKDWIAKQPHLRARTDDQWLLSFLRGCKFSLERTKSKLDLYYTMRSIAPDVTSAVKVTDPKFNEIIDLGVNVMLPNSPPNEPRVGLFRSGAFDPSKYTMSEILSVSLTLQQITIMEDDTAMVAGVKNIMDLDGVTMGHLSQMTPGLMKKTGVFQEALPIRMKGVHYLNTPPGFETIYNFMYNLLSEKIRSRFHVHNKNYEQMYKVIPKEILPTEYGGNAGSIQDINDYWKKKVAEYAEFFKEEEQFGTDEKKRVGRPKISEDMFGVDGSFRQLQLDVPSAAAAAAAARLARLASVCAVTTDVVASVAIF